MKHTLKATLETGIIPTLTINGSIPVVGDNPAVRLVESVTQELNPTSLILHFETDVYNTWGNDSLLIQPFEKLLENGSQYESISIIATHGDVLLKVEGMH